MSILICHYVRRNILEIKSMKLFFQVSYDNDSYKGIVREIKEILIVKNILKWTLTRMEIHVDV